MTSNDKAIATAKKLRDLASFLRMMAGHIESDMLESRPDALVLVLANGEKNEVLWSGISDRSRLQRIGQSVIKSAFTAPTQEFKPRIFKAE